MRVDVLLVDNAQNLNHTSHFRIGTHYRNLLKIGEEIRMRCGSN